MYKVLTLLGNRPQFIKAALLSSKFTKHDKFQEVIVHSGQHFDHNMSALFFEELELPKPKYNLGIRSLGNEEMVEAISASLIPILQNEQPDMLLVYGDTNSTLAGALAAKLFSIPIVHVEAGVRSFNESMPEEKNRTWVDKISRLLFAPSATAVSNLEKENVQGKVIFAGDIMKDMVLHFKQQATPPKDFVLDDFVLATIHRQANTDNIQTLRQIMDALNIINKERPIVLPLHPRTKKAIKTAKIKCDFKIIEPVSYLEMLFLLEASSLVITDSGGLQKEAYYLKRPCIVVRETTEWIELKEAAYSLLCDPVSTGSIINNYKLLQQNQPDFDKVYYGDGNATNVIFNGIQDFLNSLVDLLD